MTPRPDNYVTLTYATLGRTDLTPAAKIIFGILVDRIGDNSECWPGVRRLATDSGLGVGTVVGVIAQLYNAGLIEKTRPQGKRATAHYQLGRSESERSESERSKPERSESERSESERSESERSESERSKPERSESERERSESERNHPHEPEPSESKRGGEPTAAPSPGPDTGKPDGALFPEPARKAPRFAAALVEGLYTAYPRHVGRARALAAIRSALAIIAARNGVPDPAAWLLARVKAFAVSPAGRAGLYTPHACTWFGQGRFDDDPAEWQREREGNGQRPRATLKLREAIVVKEVGQCQNP